MSLYGPTPDLDTLHADAFAQASCYSLPYGAVGFSSHLITYYTMIILILGRTPLSPWRRLKYPTTSAISGVIQFIGSTVLSCISISRCHAEEPFRLMGAWMLMTSVAVSITTIAAPYAFGTTKEAILAKKVMEETIKKERKSFDLIAFARMEASDRKFPLPKIVVQLYVEDPARKEKREIGRIGLFWVAIIWVAGSIMGVYGVIQFCDGRWNAISTLNTVTAVFGIVVFSPTLWIVCRLKGGMESDTFWMLVVIQLGLVCSLGLLWMDWTVAAMTGNLIGVPGTSGSDGKVATRLSWLYFAFKRLPLLGL